MSDLTDKWVSAYKQAAMSCASFTQLEMQYKHCFDQFPTMNPNNPCYNNLSTTDQHEKTCCALTDLHDCLYKVMLQDGINEEEAIEHAYLLTKMWSLNDPARCEKKLTKSSNPCLIHYSRTLYWVAIAVSASLIFGTPLTYLLVKYGLRWYCCGQRPNLSGFSRLRQAFLSRVDEGAAS